MRPLFFFGMLPMCYLIIFSRKSKHLSEKFLSEADFFFTFRNLYHEYCAILPKKMPVFSGNKSIHPVSASASAAAVQEGIETQVRGTAAQTAAVVPSISHIGLLHALIGESGRFQLLNQMLILIVARFHLCRCSRILQRSGIVSGTGVGNRRNVIPLCIPLGNAVQHTDRLLKSAVSDKIDGRLQMCSSESRLRN